MVLYGQNLPYKFKNSYSDFRNRNFEKSHRITGSDAMPCALPCEPGADITSTSTLTTFNERRGSVAYGPGDKAVNVEDILGVLSQYRKEDCGNFADVAGPDGMADCVVGVHDLLFVLGNFWCAA